MRVLVCGGRNYSDRDHLFAVLDQVNGLDGPFAVLIHGAARGADRLAGEWARARGIPEKAFPAKWSEHHAGCRPQCRRVTHNEAGNIRNQQMLDEGKPTLVLAFHGGRGTRDMVDRALAAEGVIVIPVRS